jgi:hypothetical protein
MGRRATASVGAPWTDAVRAQDWTPGLRLACSSSLTGSAWCATLQVAITQSGGSGGELTRLVDARHGLVVRSTRGRLLAEVFHHIFDLLIGVKVAQSPASQRHKVPQEAAGLSRDA